MKPKTPDLSTSPHRLRLYGQRPQGGSAPLVLHFHGGHFDTGDLDSGRVVAQMLADAGAVVASIDYPLAPDHPFPAAAEAGHEVLTWLQKHRAGLAGPASSLWVAGEEAGGNLAAALAMMARDRRSPPLAGQILLSPMLDPCVATASLRNADGGPVGCRWADGWHRYLASALDSDHPYAVPSHATRLNDLPPTLLVTAKDDVLRDETRQFAKRLRAAGVEAQEVVLAGPTGWPCSFMGPECSDATEWIAELNEPLRQWLARANTPIENQN
jgi:acetyl esterase